MTAPPLPAAMPRADWVLALALAGATALLRWPARARLLPTWDAVQFALALGEYDVGKHQPHPPGYVLYVGLARAVHLLVGDPAATFAVVAIGASAVAVLLLYRLGWTLWGRPTAAVAAAGLAASPLFWFYGLVGLSYAAEAALATAVALLAWRLGQGRRGALASSALLLGAAGGFRQSMLLVLLPLWLAAAWQGTRRWRAVVVGLGLMGLASLAWLVPMIVLSGGLGRYLDAGRELFDSTVRPTTVLAGGWPGNLARLGEAGLLGFGLLAPLVLAGLVGLRGAGWRGGWRVRWLAAWVLPPLAVYLAVHVGQYGYLLTVLPALYLAAARILVLAVGRLEAALPARAPVLRARAVAALGGVLCLHAGFALAAPPVDVGFPAATAPAAERWADGLRAFYRFRLWAHTAPGLCETETVLAAYVDAVRRQFDPADTVLVTEVGNPRSAPWFRHVAYYLPEYPAVHLRLGGLSRGYLASVSLESMAAVSERDVPLPASTRRLVWVVDHWDPRVPRPPGLEARPLPGGRWLYVLAPPPRDVRHAGYRLVPVTALARLR